MKFVAQLLMRPLSCQLWAAMAYVAMPAEKLFADIVSALKTRRGIAELHSRLHQGLLLDLAYDMFGHVCSNGYAQRCGLTLAPHGGMQLARQSTFLQCVF